jgi:hypothetical protein
MPARGARKGIEKLARYARRFEEKFGEAHDYDYMFPDLDAAGNYSREEIDVIGLIPVRKQLGFHWLAGLPSDSQHRSTHSILTMHYASEIANALKLPESEKRHLRVAALLHDFGQPVFSHVVDKILERRFGVDHEKYAEKQLLGGGLGRFLEQRQLDPKRVNSLIKGEGVGAALTDYADKMAYLTIDAKRIYGPWRKPTQRMLDAVRKMRSNFTLREGRVVVKDEKAAREFFNLRRRLQEEGYNNAAFLLNEESLAKAVEGALDEKIVTEEELRRGDEEHVYYKLGRDSRLRSLLDLGAGYFEPVEKGAKMAELGAITNLVEHSKFVEKAKNVSVVRLSELNGEGKRLFSSGALRKSLEAALRKNMRDHEFVVAQSRELKPAEFYSASGKKITVKPTKKGLLVLSSLHPEAKEVFRKTIERYLQ